MSTEQKHSSPRQGKITLLRDKKRWSSSLRASGWVQSYLPSFGLEIGRWRGSRAKNHWFIQTNFGLCSKLHREQVLVPACCLAKICEVLETDWVWYWTGVKTREFYTCKSLYQAFLICVFSFPLSELRKNCPLCWPSPQAVAQEEQRWNNPQYCKKNQANWQTAMD